MLFSGQAATQRALAARAIGRMGTPKRALSALRRAAFDPDAEVQKSALWALLVHGPAAVMPHLQKHLAKKKVSNAEFIMAALRHLGPAAEDALPALRRKARNGRGELARLAGETIITIERSLAHVADVASPDREVRREAILAMLDYGHAAADGVA